MAYRIHIWPALGTAKPPVAVVIPPFCGTGQSSKYSRAALGVGAREIGKDDQSAAGRRWCRLGLGGVTTAGVVFATMRKGLGIQKLAGKTLPNTSGRNGGGDGIRIATHHRASPNIPRP
jgi:hypothetical protein